MSDTQLLIARLRIATEIGVKLKLVDELRHRCMQKIEEIKHKYGEAKIVEIPDANAKLKELSDQLMEAEPAFTSLSERYRQTTANLVDLTDPRFDRTAPEMLRSLERLQSVWEAELLLLDDLMTQLEGKRPS